MAVFEQRSQPKVTLDDTTPLTCTIESAQSLKDFTEYVIRVQRGPISENTWTVTKRYSDFLALDGILKPSGIDLHLPPKKVFGNMNREFIAERQLALQSYLNKVLEQPYLACHLSVKRFLDPSSYSSNLQEIALQQISMFFRSDNEWEVQEPLPEMGLRLRKQYFAIKNKNQPKEKYVLSWANFGPDKFMPNNHLLNLLKLFPTFQHPNIAPVLSATSNDTCGVTIRNFQEEGTLRDIMCKAKPKAGYLKKYGNPKERVACHLNAVKLFGRQILETLKFLHDKGIPYGHLHAGNILMVENQVKLVDLENCLFGLPCHLRSYIVQFRKINTLELIDVYCFGHLMYEMLVGETLKSPSCVTFPASCTPEARAILEAILSPEACKNGLPTVEDLLTQPLFKSIMLPASEKPQVKIPSKLKEALRDAKAAVEKRLHEEQKVYHQQKRISKAQAFHMSEEEKTKRRRSKKKQLNMNGQEKESTKVSSGLTEEKEPVANGVAPVPPPPPPPPPAAPAPPPAVPPPGVPSAPASTAPSGGRGALLSSICGFNKGGLKKSDTVDKSGPRL